MGTSVVGIKIPERCTDKEVNMLDKTERMSKGTFSRTKLR
jgi:hypothetical protein